MFGNAEKETRLIRCKKREGGLNDDQGNFGMKRSEVFNSAEIFIIEKQYCDVIHCNGRYLSVRTVYTLLSLSLLKFPDHFCTALPKKYQNKCGVRKIDVVQTYVLRRTY